MLLVRRQLPRAARCVWPCALPCASSKSFVSCLSASRRAISTSQTRSTTTSDNSSTSDTSTQAESIAALIELSDMLLVHEAGMTLPPINEEVPLVTSPAAGEAEQGDDAEAIMQLCLDPLADNAVDIAGSACDALDTESRRVADVEAQVRAWLTRRGSDATTRAAAALVLSGLDVKAVLRDGTLMHSSLQDQCLRRCDFSTMTWHGVRATRCDFALCLFYTAQLCDVTFVDCCFDGAVWSKAVCRGKVRFVRCRFYRAAMGFVCNAADRRTAPMKDMPTSGTKRRASHHGDDKLTIRFEACDFDLADFDGCRGLRHPACFHKCRNYETAANFPLRTHGR